MHIGCIVRSEPGTAKYVRCPVCGCEYTGEILVLLAREWLRSLESPDRVLEAGERGRARAALACALSSVPECDVRAVDAIFRQAINELKDELGPCNEMTIQTELHHCAFVGTDFGPTGLADRTDRTDRTDRDALAARRAYEAERAVRFAIAKSIAVELVRRCVRHIPALVDYATSVLARIYLNMGDLKSAEREFGRCGDRTQHARALARLYMEQGRYEEAERQAFISFTESRRVYGDDHEDTRLNLRMAIHLRRMTRTSGANGANGTGGTSSAPAAPTASTSRREEPKEQEQQEPPADQQDNDRSIASSVDVVECARCGSEAQRRQRRHRRCARCRSARYCSLECHELDWPLHRAQCTRALVEAMTEELEAKRRGPNGPNGPDGPNAPNGPAITGHWPSREFWILSELVNLMLGTVMGEIDEADAVCSRILGTHADATELPEYQALVAESGIALCRARQGLFAEAREILGSIHERRRALKVDNPDAVRAAECIGVRCLRIISLMIESGPGEGEGGGAGAKEADEAEAAMTLVGLEFELAEIYDPAVQVPPLALVVFSRVIRRVGKREAGTVCMRRAVALAKARWGERHQRRQRRWRAELESLERP